jgi:DNA polymerase-4
VTLRSLLVDFNSYFASVEQQVEPRLRGKPLGVVPMFADTTVCIAASVEAKTFGVKTGTKVGDAKKMCPGIELVLARHELYIDFHHRAVAAVDSSCRCVPCSPSTRWIASSPAAGGRSSAPSISRRR